MQDLDRRSFLATTATTVAVPFATAPRASTSPVVAPRARMREICAFIKRLQSVSCAERHGFERVEWLVHAVNCANPNPKLHRVLERRGFQIETHSTYGEVFRLLEELNDPDAR